MRTLLEPLSLHLMGAGLCGKGGGGDTAPECATVAQGSQPADASLVRAGVCFGAMSSSLVAAACRTHSPRTPLRRPFTCCAGESWVGDRRMRAVASRALLSCVSRTEAGRDWSRDRCAARPLPGGPAPCRRHMALLPSELDVNGGRAEGAGRAAGRGRVLLVVVSAPSVRISAARTVRAWRGAGWGGAGRGQGGWGARPSIKRTCHARATASPPKVVGFVCTGWLYEMKKQTFPVRTRAANDDTFAIHLVGCIPAGSALQLQARACACLRTRTHAVACLWGP